MNQSKLYISLITVVLTLAACAPMGVQAPISPLQGQVPISPLPAPSGNEPMIVYTRNGGIGGIQETWRIYADGQVELAARDKITPYGQLAADSVNKAMQQIVDSGFFSLAENYMPENRCCDRFTYSLTVLAGQRSKMVITMEGAEQPPALASALAIVSSLIQQATPKH